MQPGYIYRGVFTNAQANPDSTANEQLVIVSIYDMDELIEDSDTPVIEYLEMAAEPVIVEVIDNEEDKFSPIRAKSCTIKVLTSSLINIATFVNGSDNRWKVEIAINELDRIVFIGFLSLSDIRQLFQPDPNELELVGYDGLGGLKDMPLTDFNGDNPENEHRLMDYIAWCLDKTGLELDIYAIMNVRHGAGDFTIDAQFQTSGDFMVVANSERSRFYPGQRLRITGTVSNNITATVTELGSPSIVTLVGLNVNLIDEALANATFEDLTARGHFYDKIFVDAKTWEDEIGTCIDCYTVLERILGEGGFVTQYKGRWYIRWIDEMDGNDDIQAVFDPSGEFVDYLPATQLVKDIGVGLSLSWMNDDAEVSGVRPNGLQELTFNYETPRELPCNPEFERGDLETTVSAEEKHFSIDCWTEKRANYPTSDLIPATTNIYTRRDYINGREDKRYVVIEDSATASNLIMSEPIPAGLKSKFNFTFSRRLSADQGGSSDYTDTIAQVRLYGNDGSHYTLKGATSVDPEIKWVLSNSDWTSNNQLIQVQGNTSADERDTVSVTTNAPPTPVAGYVRILLYQSAVFGDVADTYIEPPTVEYAPFVNGTYDKYTGHQYKISQGEKYKAKREKEVFISDSPDKLYKGSLLFQRINDQLFSGSVVFFDPGFQLTGDQTVTYYAGRLIYIESASNTGFYRVVSSVYNIIGNTTAVTIDPGPVTITESAVIYDAAFELASRFYNGSAYPNDDPPADGIHPYGHLQAFSVWNQFNRTFFALEGTVDGLDTGELDADNLPDLPDIVHRFRMQDASIATNNKLFMLMHRSQDLNLCQMDNLYFVEVFDSGIAKKYDDDFEFKYVSSDE